MDKTVCGRCGGTLGRVVASRAVAGLVDLLRRCPNCGAGSRYRMRDPFHTGEYPAATGQEKHPTAENSQLVHAWALQEDADWQTQHASAIARTPAPSQQIVATFQSHVVDILQAEAKLKADKKAAAEKAAAEKTAPEQAAAPEPAHATPPAAAPAHAEPGPAQPAAAEQPA